MKEKNKVKITKLAQYRKKLDLSQQQIADAIKLGRDSVKHLEEGRFEKLGAAPYIRGHIINYCKQVGIDHQQILSQLPADLLLHQKVQRAKNLLPNNISKVKVRTGNFGRYLAGTGLLAILLFSVYFIWDKANPFQAATNNNLIPESGEQTITYSSMLPPVSEKTYQEPVQRDDKTIVEDSSLDIKNPTENEPAVQATEPQTNNSDIQDSLPNSEEPPLSEAKDTQPVDNKDAKEVKDVEVKNTEIEGEQRSTTAAHTFNIEFNLSEQAWVSIKTTQGEKIIQDLIGPGQRTYHSNQAMDFKIGNAKQVTIHINGEPIELNRFTRENVANFHWPPKES